MQAIWTSTVEFIHVYDIAFEILLDGNVWYNSMVSTLYRSDVSRYDALTDEILVLMEASVSGSK